MIVFSNTTPLIALAGINRLDLLAPQREEAERLLRRASFCPYHFPAKNAKLPSVKYVINS